MRLPRWIDSCGALAVGDVGFLTETVRNNERGATSWHLSPEPLRTNQSHEPRLFGWCGETDNVSRFAHGMARVEALSKNKQRARIAAIDQPELAPALETAGYPDLHNQTAL